MMTNDDLEIDILIEDASYITCPEDTCIIVVCLLLVILKMI